MDTDKKLCLYPCCNADATTPLQLCNEHSYHADYRSFRDQLRQKRDQPKEQSEVQKRNEADELDNGLAKLLEGAGIPVEAEGTAVAVLRQEEAEQKRIETILAETVRAEILKRAKDCSKSIMLVPTRYMVFDEAGNHVGWSTDAAPVSGPSERAGRIGDLGQALLALKHSDDVLEQARRLRKLGSQLIDFAQELIQAYNTRTMS
jgi:hypothetical protein